MAGPAPEGLAPRTNGRPLLTNAPRVVNNPPLNSKMPAGLSIRNRSASMMLPLNWLVPLKSVSVAVPAVFVARTVPPSTTIRLFVELPPAPSVMSPRVRTEPPLVAVNRAPLPDCPTVKLTRLLHTEPLPLTTASQLVLSWPTVPRLSSTNAALLITRREPLAPMALPMMRELWTFQEEPASVTRTVLLVAFPLSTPITPLNDITRPPLVMMRRFPLPNAPTFKSPVWVHSDPGSATTTWLPVAVEFPPINGFGLATNAPLLIVRRLLKPLLPTINWLACNQRAVGATSLTSLSCAVELAPMIELPVLVTIPFSEIVNKIGRAHV